SSSGISSVCRSGRASASADGPAPAEACRLARAPAHGSVEASSSPVGLAQVPAAFGSRDEVGGFEAAHARGPVRGGDESVEFVEAFAVADHAKACFPALGDLFRIRHAPVNKPQSAFPR